MSSSKSTEDCLPVRHRIDIEYKRPTALLLLTILTLYPSPSPLFYITCLPVLILLHRHDPRLFFQSATFCLGVVTLVADLGEGRKILNAGFHSLMVACVIAGTIDGHYRLSSTKRVAIFESLLFGLLWGGCGVISRTLHHVS
jgi:hypothetical protein